MGNLAPGGLMKRRRKRRRTNVPAVENGDVPATANELPQNSEAQAPNVQATWSCPGCTFKETVQRPGCSMCSAERPYEADPERPLDFLKGRFECDICGEDDMEIGVCVRQCLCEMCKSCLHRFIMDAGDGMPKCPKCDKVLPDLVIRKVLPPKDRQRQQRLLAAASKSNLTTFHCRTPNCNYFVELDDQRKTPFFQCAACKIVNCVECGAQHEGESCNEFKNRATSSPEEQQTKEYLEKQIEENKVMQCPACKTAIERSNGCFWLRCANPACKVELCWLTKGPRWGPGGRGDTSGGCRCGVDGKKCHPKCWSCNEG